jgi:hypothetical protein
MRPARSAVDFGGLLLDACANRDDGGFDAALDGHGVGAGGDVLEAFVDHGLRQDRCGGRAVTGDVVGLGGGFFQKLRAHVLEGVFQLDLLGDGDAVGAHVGGAELLVDDDVTAAGPERHLDGVGQFVHASLKRLSCLVAVDDLFCHRLLPP